MTDFSANLLRQLPAARRQRFLESLTELEAAALLYDWPFWARCNQKPPGGDWVHWLLLAGRGFGKTRTGAEWVRRQVEEGTAHRIALVAPTIASGRAVMVEGDSGLLAVCPPWNRPKFEASKRMLSWPNGATATLFSAEEPERLRGPQHDAAWCDELCAWRRDDETWDMLMFGLRLGAKPRSVITTTPKPTGLIKRLVAADAVAMTRGSTYDNLDNLAPTFASEIVAKYRGTRLGRQELMAEMLEDVPGALWTRRQLDRLRRADHPPLTHIVVAVDPPASLGDKADECGIVAAGIDDRGFGHVLADASVRGLSPHGWGSRVLELYRRLKGDHIVIETNQGGAMATSVLGQLDNAVPVRGVHASRGKYLRAEPVAALYEQGRVFHAGLFEQLEDQMTSFTGPARGTSPDRLDALVWALTDLMLKPANRPRIRTL